MANLIELAKSYVPMLDEVYKLASCTSDLDGAPELARQGANANELIVPMRDVYKGQATRWCCARSPIHCEIVCTRRCSGP